MRAAQAAPQLAEDAQLQVDLDLDELDADSSADGDDGLVAGSGV